MMAGQDAAPAGVVTQLHPRAVPRVTPAGYYGPALGRAPLRTRKREKPRGASTGAYYQVQRLLGAPHPSHWGTEKETGPPRPTQMGDRQSVGFFRFCVGLFDV